MATVPWFQRSFSFDTPLHTWPEVVERFRGLPPRIEDKIRPVSRATLTASDGGWSILENIGHLLVLDKVFGGRIEDFLAGAPILRAADLENKATFAARFNEWDTGELCRALRTERERQAALLDTLTESDFARTSLHPRLKQPMRLLDAVTFVCLHDDYHLARMTELVRKFA
jgi:uncharacterized damage-inducible protein DinB